MFIILTFFVLQVHWMDASDDAPYFWSNFNVVIGLCFHTMCCVLQTLSNKFRNRHYHIAIINTTYCR